MAGTSRETQHRRVPKEDGAVPVVEVDYCLPGMAAQRFPTPSDQNKIVILTAVDNQEGNVLTIYMRSKGGTDEQVVASVLKWLEGTGWHKVITKADQENALDDVARTVAARREKATEIKLTPKGSKGSLGLAESTHFMVQGRIRTMLIVLRGHYEGEEVSPQHRPMPWLVRHVGWLLSRLQVRADGRTAWERRTGKTYKHEILEFGEQCMLKHQPKTKEEKLEPRWEKIVWVGKVDDSDEHLGLSPPCTQKISEASRGL